MFDYAISSNKGQRLTSRTLSSYGTSCILHFLMILALIEYPGLLRGGMYHRFRSIFSSTESLISKPPDDEGQWRTVAVLQPQSKMMAPSATTLKKYLYDWDKKGSGNAAPPIRIRFSDEQKSAIHNLPPMPQVQQAPQQPELTLPANALASGNASTSSASSPSPSGIGDGSGRREWMGVLPQASAPKSETAESITPKSIPDGVKPPASSSPATAGGLKVFETEQKAIHSPDSGIFDTKGFPLGEYVNVIKERIKGNWFIPSNLQNFQGHTTIIFYIDRGGRYANARIVTKSGSNSFDNAALMAVITSDPFPPLPEGFPGNHIGAKFVLSWNEP